MAFTWKEHKDIWKGEGIYFLTFVVNNRVPLLGKLRRLETGMIDNARCDRDVMNNKLSNGENPGRNEDSEHHIATVDPYDLGMEVYREFRKLQSRHAGFQVISKQIMPNHFHAVVRCHEEFTGSIKMVARGFSQACSKIARRLLAEGRLTGAVDPGAYAYTGRCDRPFMDSNTDFMDALDSKSLVLLSVKAQSDCATNYPAYCGNGANTLFEKPFIRTLCHAGQLDRMIKYTHNNPDNLQRVIDNPTLYTIRRNLHYANLHFDGMGKERLLDYPDRQVIALSRTLTQEQIEAEVAKALYNAERGTVTYTAAINEGEKAVSKAIRENGYPLVVMMLDGFPHEDSETARYFHPSGVYHKVCGEGRLMLLAPKLENYDDPRLIELTEAELTRKAAEKGLHYTGLPHDTKRWRMIAGNVMLRMIADVE